MADEKVIIEIDLDTVEAIKDLGSFAKTAATAGRKSGGAFAGGFGSSLASVAIGNIVADAFQGALSSVRNAVASTVNAARDLEVFETQFRVILGN